jgi:hypothetical protein
MQYPIVCVDQSAKSNFMGSISIFNFAPYLCPLLLVYLLKTGCPCNRITNSSAECSFPG